MNTLFKLKLGNNFQQTKKFLLSITKFSQSSLIYSLNNANLITSLSKHINYNLYFSNAQNFCIKFTKANLSVDYNRLIGIKFGDSSVKLNNDIFKDMEIIEKENETINNIKNINIINNPDICNDEISEVEELVFKGRNSKRPKRVYTS